MMPRALTVRKRKFKAALAWAGITQGQWAAQQGVTPSYVSHILTGFMESKTLTDKIDEFTAKQIKAICANGTNGNKGNGASDPKDAAA